MNASGRRILAGLFWLLASLGIMLSTVVVWAHESLLTTSGWTRLVGEVFDDPEVIDGTADAIVVRVADAVDLDALVAQVLPGERQLIANFVTLRIEDWLSDQLGTILAREDVQAALGRVNATAHDVAMDAIHGGGDVLSSEQGTIALNVFPLVGAVLEALQEAGVIDASREIPDLSEYQPPAETVARLESLLGRDLPDDIGTIELVSSDRLATVQQTVQRFDLLTAVVLVATLLLVGLALWLSRRRLRMVVWLAVGAIAALALGRAFTRLVIEDISGSLAAAPGGETVRAVTEAAVDQIMWASFVVIALAVVIAGVAMWLDQHAATPPDGETAANGDTPPDGETAADRSLGDRIHAHRQEIGMAGLGVIAFLVLWRVGGPDIALLAATATGGWLILVSVLAGRRERKAAASTPADTGSGGT